MKPSLKTRIAILAGLWFLGGVLFGWLADIQAENGMEGDERIQCVIKGPILATAGMAYLGSSNYKASLPLFWGGAILLIGLFIASLCVNGKTVYWQIITGQAIFALVGLLLLARVIHYNNEFGHG